MKYLQSDGSFAPSKLSYIRDAMEVELKINSWSVPLDNDFGFNKIVDGLDLSSSREFIGQRIIRFIDIFNEHNGCNLSVDGIDMTESTITVTLTNGDNIETHEIDR